MNNARGDDMIWYAAHERPGTTPQHVCPAITIVSQWVRRDVLDPVAVGTCFCCGGQLPAGPPPEGDQ